MIYIDLPADLNLEGDQGRNIARLGYAVAPGYVYGGYYAAPPVIYYPSRPAYVIAPPPAYYGPPSLSFGVTVPLQ